MSPEALNAVYAAIGDCTPMRTDCGLLCGAACCYPDDEGAGGVCLLPGEEALLDGAPWAELGFDAQMARPMLICRDACDRARRPFLCRVFPLCPTMGKNGWTVRPDARARALCPLSRGGLRALDPAFVRGCVRAARRIAADAEGEAFLRRWAEIEAEFRKPLW